MNNSHKEVEKAYDRVAKEYDTNYLRAIDLAENNVTFDMAQAYGLNKGSVLDVGCGTALFLEYVKPTKEYVGTDISKGMLAVARAKFPDVEFIKDDMVNRNIKLIGRFDNVVSLFGSFSYVLNPLDAVNNMADTLKKRGRVMVMALGSKYRKRGHHILGNGFPFLTYDAPSLDALFSTRFKRVNCLGLNAFGERLNWLGEGVLTRYLQIEGEQLQYLLPHSFYYTIYIGEKRA